MTKHAYLATIQIEYVADNQWHATQLAQTIAAVIDRLTEQISGVDLGLIHDLGPIEDADVVELADT